MWFFDSSFFSSLMSWVPIINTEPLLFSLSVEHVVVEVVLTASCGVFSGRCIAVRCVDTLDVDRVTPQNSHEVCFHPCPKTHLVWTRRLHRTRIRSHRQDTAILIVWEKGRTALGECCCKHVFQGAMAHPMVPKTQHFPESPNISIMVRLIPQLLAMKISVKRGGVTRVLTRGVALVSLSAFCNFDGSVVQEIGCGLSPSGIWLCSSFTRSNS